MDVAGTTTLHALDEDGSETPISPHAYVDEISSPTDPLPWTYVSTNRYIGKRVKVDMSGAIRALEELTGKQFIYYEDTPKTDVEVWKNVEHQRMKFRWKQTQADVLTEAAQVSGATTVYYIKDIEEPTLAQVPEPTLSKWVMDRIDERPTVEEIR
jgi:hypothetical protein